MEGVWGEEEEEDLLGGLGVRIVVGVVTVGIWGLEEGEVVRFEGGFCMCEIQLVG